MTVVSEKQKLKPDNEIQLLAITYGSTVYRYCTSVIDPGDTVTWDGDVYLARQFSLTGLSRQGGKAPRPRLSINNVDRLFYNIVATKDELLGATVNYYEVYRDNLDDGGDPDASEILSEYTFDIFQMRLLTNEKIDFELKTAADRETSMAGRVCNRNLCPYKTYRSPDTSADTFIQGLCPYTGSNYYKKDGTSTSDWREDECAQTRQACVLRYGEGVDLPFLGFPGIGQPDI